MKKLFFLPFALFLLIGVNLNAQKAKDIQTVSFKVYGNCGMCEDRIESALIVPGVRLADWDQATGMLTVTFKPFKISLQAIHEIVAGVGHDTDLAKAKDAVYDKLPGCCLYERPKI
ncbi:MAG: heavy-metal-associated domain-containing protein [Saprospirales bacterium]|jgi:mercuric ion binding protein|nr:heavy-metal-associated domain-containing protein [Saprospirales bacterium]